MSLLLAGNTAESTTSQRGNKRNLEKPRTENRVIDKTEWHSRRKMYVAGKMAETAAEYMKKGQGERRKVGLEISMSGNTKTRKERKTTRVSDVQIIYIIAC